MKTLTHLRIMAAAVLLLLFACRQEITTIDDHNSKREQEFFRDAQEKTAKLGNGNFVIDLLKKENDKTHFVTRLKDQNGLPVWDKITLTGSSNTNKINTSDTLTVAIPLSEDKEYLSSLLIAKVANGGIIQIKNIDNTDLYRYVNDSSVPAYKRETALLNFIYADHKVFGTKYYINIPADLFPDIELRTGESKKRMNIVSISEEDISSFAVPIRICVTREDVCGHCSGTVILGYKTECFTYIGEYTDGGSGEDGGSGDTSGDTGGGGGSPGSGSSECEKGGWYRVVPPGCPNGDDLPVVVQNLKNRLLSYGEQYDIYLYEPYLASNLTVAEKFGAYLTQNNNPQAAAFVMWGLEFLSQNTGTTWAQFENWFITGTLTASQMSEFLLDLNNPDTVKPTKRFKNNAKINAIYNQAKTVSNFKQYLHNFEPTFSVAHLIFDIGTCKYSTSLAETSEPVNYQIQIIFNKDKDWTNMPKIVIADTFMHEMIHAEIFRKLLSLASSNGNIDVNLLKQYLNAHNYPGLFDYYVRYVKGDSSFQHESMAAHYVTIMVNFLKQMYGTKYTDVEYKTVVWMGLKGTTAWNLLPQSEKTLYDNTWNTNYWLWEK